MSDSEVCQVNDSNDEVMDIEGASRFLKCGTSTLYRYVCNRSIPCIKLGSRTLFKRSENYVGTPENMPTGTMEPYALVEVTDGSYTMKDRIIRNNVFKVKIELNLQKKKLVWRYFTALRKAFDESEHSEGWRIREEKHEKSGKMGIEVVER